MEQEFGALLITKIDGIHVTTILRSKKTPTFHLLKPKQHRVVKFTFYGFSIFIEYKPTANREENLHICILKSKNIIY